MQNRMLSEYRLFAGLSEEECQAVLGCIGGWESPAQKGELLAHAGEELAAMGLVLEGRVDILSTDYWGSETLMARLGPGELFGEVFAGQGVELPYDLVAAEDCRILWLRPDRLMTGCCEACGFHQRLQRNLLALLAARTREMSRKAAILSQRSIRGRLMEYLSDRARAAGSASFELGFTRQRLADYLTELESLDQSFRDVVAGGSRRLLVFGDRFPLLYFCREYGLDYRAAFHGCAGDTEPSLATLKYLIDLVNEEHIPVVYTIELSSRKVAEAIAETTGAAVRTFQSCQTVSRADFDNGVTYLQLMEANVDALREGLA